MSRKLPHASILRIIPAVFLEELLPQWLKRLCLQPSAQTTRDLRTRPIAFAFSACCSLARKIRHFLLRTSSHYLSVEETRKEDVSHPTSLEPFGSQYYLIGNTFGAKSKTSMLAAFSSDHQRSWELVKLHFLNLQPKSLTCQAPSLRECPHAAVSRVNLVISYWEFPALT